MNYFMVSKHGGATEWSGNNTPAHGYYETYYISDNSERGLHFTAQLKHVVTVTSD
jgi:hypothetical protein